MKEVVEILTTVFTFVALVFYNAFCWGFVASILIAWFVVPVYPDFVKLTWLQYAGIMLVIQCFLPTSSCTIKEEYKDKDKMILRFIINPWLLLLIGAILHLIY